MTDNGSTEEQLPSKKPASMCDHKGSLHEMIALIKGHKLSFFKVAESFTTLNISVKSTLEVTEEVVDGKALKEVKTHIVNIQEIVEEKNKSPLMKGFQLFKIALVDFPKLIKKVKELEETLNRMCEEMEKESD